MASSLDLGQGGSAAFPFEHPGDSVTGTIKDLEEVQQTDMDSNEPAFWPDGKPKMMFRVVLSTDLRDPNDPHDDGERSVYLRGSKKPESQSSLAAVIAAVRAATGRLALNVGGRLTLTYIGDGEQTRRGYNAPKRYAAQYQAPALNLGGGPAVDPAQAAPTGVDPWGNPQAAQPPAWAQPPAQQAPPAPPVQQYAPPAAPQQPPAPAAPAAPAPDPTTLAALQAAGIDPATVFPGYTAT